MAKSVTFSVRMDSDTKESLDKFCESIGLSVSAFFNMVSKVTIRQNKIPFEIQGSAKISDDPFWNDEATVAKLRESVRQLESGNGLKHNLIED